MSESYSGQAIFGGTTDPVTGSWTSASALNSAITSSDITGYGVVVASFSVSGTVSAGTAIFEVSDDGGTTWWPINGLQTGNNAQAVSVSLASSTSWEFATGAYNLFRVRLNPQISGSGTVNVRLSAEAFPFTTSIAVSGTVTVTGTVAATQSGTWTVQQGGAPWSVSQSGAWNVGLNAGTNVIGHVITDSGSTTVVTGTVAVTQSGSWAVTSNQGTANPLSPWNVVLNAETTKVIGTVNQGTSPWVVSGTVTANQGTANPLSPWNVVLNAETTKVIGTVNQGTSPWVTNVTQFGSSNVVTGAGASGSGIPRVTVSNDSKIIAWDGTNTTVVKPASTGAVTADPALVVTMSPNTISVPVTSAPAYTSNASVATWNSGTALNTTAAIISNTDSYQSLIITLNQTTTITAGQLTFEVSSDGSHWVAITGVDASQFGTFAENGVYFLIPSTYAAGFFNITTWQYFRVRLSTVISGTGAVTIGFSAQAGGQPPVVARQPHNFGRTFICITIADTVITGTQGLVSFTLNKGGTQTTGLTSYTVTNGKTLRFQSVDQVLRSTSGTQPVATFIRADSSSVSISSPILWATLQSASTSAYDHAGMTYPDGLEIPSGEQVGVTAYNVNGNSTGRITTTIVGYEY